MTSRLAAGRPALMSSWPAMLAVGLTLGALYSVSPLTTLCLPLLALVVRWAARDLPPAERQSFLALVWVAVLMRLVVVAGLFLLADPAKPYATFFGDEELYKSESMWLRNIDLQIPVSPADAIYVYDGLGQAGYIRFLAYLQALVGSAPYGMHLVNLVLYVTAVVGLHGVIRPSFGRVPAMLGLGVLLYLPSLFIWSVSALKEPAYLLVATGELACALSTVRAPRRWQQLLACAGAVLGALLLQQLRNGGFVVAGVGIVAGLALAGALMRPRWLLASAVAGPLVAAVAFAQPSVQAGLMSVLRLGAFNHAGFVLTEGSSYQLLDPYYYTNRYLVWTMPAGEAVRFAGAAVASYITVPLPWQVASMTMLAYLPEYVAWWMLILLTPMGVRAALHRDTLVTSLLACHAGAVMVTVALNSGNIGTLIRHRGLALPYIAWLAAVGACDLARRIGSRPVTKGSLA